jgi:pimeloyl-ACP methyl ester carboxylesterase
MGMARFGVRGAELDYDITGTDGPLVVQLHGLTSSRERDELLGLNLARALRGHRILRYDARGHGRSSGSLDPDDYGWPSLANDLRELLDHVAPGERVHAVGPSMGAGTLLYAALSDPQRFATLTLVTPPTAWKSRAAQAEAYRASAAAVEDGGIGAFTERDSTAPVPPALADAPQTRSSVPESLLSSVMRGAAATDLPRKTAIATIETPTLILAWSGDHGHPLTTAHTLHRRLPASQLVIARSPYGIMAWPGLFAEFVSTGGMVAAE